MNRLTLTYKGQQIISGIFSMGAYRAIHNKLTSGIPTSTLFDAAAHDAVIFMFDGTQITDKILRCSVDINPDELIASYRKVLDWFHSVKPKPNDKQMVGTPPEDPILYIYKQLLMNSGILPDEIDRQDPQLFFDVMGADSGDMVSADELTDEQKFYYGL